MTAVPSPNGSKPLSPLLKLLKQGDILMAGLILLIIAMLIVPVPEWLLDTMLDDQYLVGGDDSAGVPVYH